MGKYTIIKKFEGILRNGSCPVQVENYNILLNNDTGKNIIQIQLRNTGNKVIKSVFLDIDCYDDTKDYLTTLKENAYVGLNAVKGDVFGGKRAISADTNVIGNIAVKITKIAFTDDSVWKNENDAYLEEMPKPANSFEHFGELYDQYKRECDKEKLNYTYAFTEYEEYWQCVCGQPNNNENETCFNCGASREVLEKISDRAFLEEEKEKYEEAEKQRLEAERQEKIEEEERLEKERQEKLKIQERNKKVKKISLAILTVCVVGICAGLAGNYGYKVNKYNNAVELLENGSYREAAEIFESLEDFKDSKLMLKESKFKLSNIMNKYISSGGFCTAAVKSDGTVVAVGDSSDGQCDVDEWTDIVEVSAGRFHTVGVKSDGTVVATGNNSVGQSNVSKWRNIEAVSAGLYYTVGLKSDGTVVAAGNSIYTFGAHDVDDWTDIVDISAGIMHTAGLKSDGTVVAVGNNGYGQCDLDDWRDIAAISTGGSHTVGLKSDGTVVAVGDNSIGQCDVDDWTDIVAVSTWGFHTVGLKSDGTVVAVGDNEDGQCDVDDWTDIVAISAGFSHTLGLKSDGTVVAVGNNDYGQCDVDDWQNIGRS